MSEADRRNNAAARWSLWLILLAALAGMLLLNLPGHLSVDSVLALHEGRFGVRETWNPAIFGWLLGTLDRISPGTALVVVLSGLMLFGSWAALAALRPRTSWLAPILAIGLVALPQAMIYPAIVWKDVLFADAALAGFVALAFAVRRPGDRARLATLALSALFFAVAGLLRQNGLILAAPAALALAWASSSSRGWGGGVRLAGCWLAAVAALTLALSAVARPQGAGAPDTAGGKGLRILQVYDLAAAAAMVPDRPTPRIDRFDPAAGAFLRHEAPRFYSPVRVDALVGDSKLGQRMKYVPSKVIRAEWLDLIRNDPGVYLRVRLAAFEQVFATPVIDRCLPATLGVEGPPRTLKALGMSPRRSAQDERLWNYLTWYLDTPAMSHLAYAAVALLVGAALLLRREPADLVVVAMLAGALAFTGSFLVVTLACDYRYLYLLDVAALSGLLYLAIDPRLRRA